MRNNVNNKAVEHLADKISINYPEFNRESFCESIIPNLNDLGLFERLDLITKKLKKFLPEDFTIAANILIKSLDREIVEDRSDLDGVDLSSGNGFIVISLTNYISDYGMNNFDLSMLALCEMTKRFSSEGSIRHFLIKFPNKTIEVLKKWAIDENVHVRRLVSEGTRPRLPWAIRLQSYVEDPTPILKFLELLKDDKELYVRRSVANNLNDIAKDNPEIVVNILKGWSHDKSAEMTWLIKHALRSLIKQGNPGALDILGFHSNPKIETSNLELKHNVILGDAQEFSFDLKSTSNIKEKLVIDYIIHHKKANGTLTPKVFKLKTMTLKAGESIIIKKKHGIREISTRKYYQGNHKLVIQINGKEYLSGNFNLSI